MIQHVHQTRSDTEPHRGDSGASRRDSTSLVSEETRSLTKRRDSRGRVIGSLKRAGGYCIGEGCARYPNIQPMQRKPWYLAVKRCIQQKLRAGDRETKTMLLDAETDFMTFEAKPLHHFGHSTPLDKAQSLIAHILQQGKRPIDPANVPRGWRRRRFSTIDILSMAMAADLMVTYWDKAPLRTPYYRAVQIGRAVRYLFRLEVNVFEQDTGRGTVRTQTVIHAPRVRSRYACQRIEKATRKHYGKFMERYGREIVTCYIGNQT